MTTFAKRRAKLMSQMQALGGGIAIIPTALERNRNGDSDFPFRFDSNFYYLTGFTEPHSVLVLKIGATGSGQAILFCRDKNVEREIWDGFRYGPSAAAQSFGFDAAYSIDEIDQRMPDFMANCATVFYAMQDTYQRYQQILGWRTQVSNNWRSGNSVPEKTVDIDALIAEMRLFKDESEIALMQRAGDISSAAHLRAMRATRPGCFEYAIEAELLYEFRRNGAQFPAYSPIVAAGANACILHYNSNNGVVKDGDLILIDAGCEFDGYAADITRTYPANGRFSGPQKDLYELVLASQLAALQQAHVGSAYMNGHNAAVRVLAQGMLDFKLLDANKVGSLEDVIEKQAYRQFYMHGTGHWLGLDVHDCGHYHQQNTAELGMARPWRALEAGMVITIEPGIYVRPSEGVPEHYWDIGIRIEDDILITANGPHHFSAKAPKTVQDIEDAMKA